MGNDATLGDVAATDGRIVVAGTVGDVTRVWTSGDAIHWTIATGFGAPDGLRRLVVGPAGGFVALGAARNLPAAWTSNDGRRWQRHLLPVDYPPSNAFIADVAVGHGIVVATGWESDCVDKDSGNGPFVLVRAAPTCRETNEVWWSVDGASWHRVPAPFLNDPDALLVSTNTGFSLVSRSSDGSVWQSLNGREWSAVPRRRCAGMDTFAYAVGRYIESSIGATATSSVFVSSDLVSWRPVASDALRQAHIEEMRVVAGAVYALGYLFRSEPGETRIWRSDDGGLSWTALSLDPAFSQLLPVALTRFYNGFQDELVVAVNEANWGDTSPPSLPSRGSVLVLPVPNA